MTGDLTDPSADDDGFSRLRDALDNVASNFSNEADTRHRIIDVVLHDILAWPRNRVSVEEYIRPGFADYILKNIKEDPIIFIEAKKQGLYFDLPVSYSNNSLSSYIQIEKFISDENIKLAMSQVRTYCLESGCEFACITNGRTWIFFKVFEKGKRWEQLQAFVARDTNFFMSEYTKAYNALSYTSIIERFSLIALLSSTPPKDREIYFAKERIVSYSHPISANILAKTLRPIVNHYFGVISDDDTEFMERCYVSERDYSHTLDGVRTLIKDSLSPYFQNYGVQQLEDTGKGGHLGGRLSKNIRKGRKGEVLVLFGGKGSGKSTFIKRLLHHNPPQWLRSHSVIALVDPLNIPEDNAVIRKSIWDGLVQGLDYDKILSSSRETILKELFADNFEIATRQQLTGLSKAGEAYNLRLNELMSEWKMDKRYCSKRLVDYWKARGKGVIVVIDNTDQYSGLNQDFCFASAQEIADELECVTLISMREERFFSSKIHGVLDAFQNAGFHISSPKPSEVFRKRLDYTIGILADADRSKIITGDTTELIEDCAKYLSIINREFLNARSPLNTFLTACAHGDTRLSLDLFRSFLLSGYTNVEEMLAAGAWNFQIHQVIKPVMIPTRYFYDETLSEIPNIYQPRYSRHSSHFTAMRIIRKLAKHLDAGAVAAYISVSELKSYFSETFNMLDDFVANMDMLLKRGFIEADNRLDVYSESVDRVIKVRSYSATAPWICSSMMIVRVRSPHRPVEELGMRIPACAHSSMSTIWCT